MNKLLIFMALSLSLCLSGCDLGTSKSSWATAKVVKTEMVYGNVLYRIVFYTLPDFDEGNRIFGNDSNLLIVFYVQIMPDDLVMQLHRF